MKTISEYSHEEKMEWAREFHLYVTNELAEVRSGNGFDKELFLKGMALVEPWPCSMFFVQDARMYMDYHARVPLLHQMFRQVQEEAKDIIAEYSAMVSNATDVLNSAKVGRPSKKEIEAMKVIGAPQPKNKREERVVVDKEMKEKITSGQLSLFGEEAEPLRTVAGKADVPSTSEQNRGEEAEPLRTVAGEEAELLRTGQGEQVVGGGQQKGALRDVAWLLSADLAERVEGVAALRGEAATNAEIAKKLAMKGGKQSEIEEYAQLAAMKTQEYQAIYREVDEELAMLYIGNRAQANYHDIETKAHEHGISSANLMGKVLMPYYKKVKAEDETFETRVIMQIQKELSAPEVDEDGNELMSSSEKSKLRQRARSYFNNICKKDTATEAQVSKMEEYVLLLKENGVEYKDLEIKLNRYKK